MIAPEAPEKKISAAAKPAATAAISRVITSAVLSMRRLYPRASGFTSFSRARKRKEPEGSFHFHWGDEPQLR